MADKAKTEAKSVLATVKPFLNGGLSGMGATCIIQPIDMVKVRLQIGATGSPVRPPLPCGGQSGPTVSSPGSPALRLLPWLCLAAMHPWVPRMCRRLHRLPLLHPAAVLCQLRSLPCLQTQTVTWPAGTEARTGAAGALRPACPVLLNTGS